MRFAVESPVLHHLLLFEYFIFLCAGVWLCACLCTVYVTGACAEVGARSGPGATYERGAVRHVVLGKKPGPPVF